MSIVALTRNCFLRTSLLSIQHLLSFSFCFFESLLFLLSFNGLLIGFLFPQFLLLFLLLLIKLLLLLGSDLLPLSLPLLQFLELLLLLLPGLPPFCDVFLECGVQSLIL